jgi:hypothetical protein
MVVMWVLFLRARKFEILSANGKKVGEVAEEGSSAA